MVRGWIVSCIVAAAFVMAGAAAAQARSCAVREVIDNGGYTYLRCREEGRQYWLAVMETSIGVGEEIFFADTPPMLNFSSKSMKRTFPVIYFAPGFSRTPSEDTERQSPYRQRYGSSYEEPAPSEPNLYSGTDDNGTMVFSDDPTKIPKKKAGNKKKKRAPSESRRDGPVNQTAMKSFTNEQQAVIRALENVFSIQCRGSLQELRQSLLADLRPMFDDLVAEAGGASAFAGLLRRECYPYFTVNKVTFGKGIQGRYTGYKSADLYFTSIEPNVKRETAQKQLVEAWFIFDNTSWKFVAFGSAWSGNYDFDQILHRVN